MTRCRNYDDAGRLRSICTTRRGRTTCTSARRSALGSGAGVARVPGGARAAALASQGLMPNAAAPVVRLWNKNPATGQYYGNCSGTIVRQGIILTAGHCLYDLGTSSWSGDARPGNCGIIAVPANNINGTFPYKAWCVDRLWVPDRYQAGDYGYDWGIAYVAPDADGKFVGSYTGIWNAYWTARFPYGTHLWKIGYPAEGMFSDAAGYFGNGQRYCDNIWSGENWDWDDSMSGYVIMISPCDMNGGSSGGPALVYFGDRNEWGLVGVNNFAHRGPQPAQQGLDGGSVYFDDRFGEFWNQTIAEINQAGL